ncbi:MAG: acyltransferase [candidate division KSB1 bacterium]|nr:acyltransferase [candidate division KSB1 bacterium]MDZ7300553.1 acyltransferase [candidate division KSB1 bacterium]MDZ7309692.1 acyltransferase [candidate division KSB1 bacterium]
MRKINISQVDTLFANGSYPIEFLFYYKNNLTTKKIRSALKSLSSVFWPMFGEYDAGVIYFDQYSEKDCFDEEVTDQEFYREETNQNIYEKYCRINPTELKKLFFLKIIQYGNGTLLIPKMNHLAGDGYSYFYFLSTLAAMSRDTSIPFKKNLIPAFYKPHHRRTILKEFRFNEIELEPLQDKEEFTVELEEISKAAIRNIIKSVAADLNRQVSTNDILSAMVAQKSAAIQKEYFGDDFQLTIPIEVRSQIEEYGPRYFGNGIMFHVIDFKTKDIEKSSVDEIAIAIRKSMPAITKESYIKYLCSLEAIIADRQTHKLKPYDPETGCLVTNLSQMPANKLDFGTGNPDLIFPLTIERNSAAILARKDNFMIRFAY